MSEANQDSTQAGQPISETQNGGEAQNDQPTNLPKTIKEIEENLHQSLKHAFVLANLYYYFQGAILTAVSQVSSPKCSQRYFFFVLSLIPLVLNGFPLIYVLYKCAKAKNKHDMYTIQAEKKRATMESKTKSNGPAAAPQPEAAQTDEYGKWMRYSSVGVAALVLVGFNGAMLYACHSLLCDHSQTTPDISFNGDCFRVCNDQTKCLQICTTH